MRRAGELVELFWGGERDLLAAGLDLAGLLAASLSLPLSLSPTFAPILVFSASASEGEYLLPLLVSALLDGEGGGVGLSICVGLYRS